jgi:hypothetical protein
MAHSGYQLSDLAPKIQNFTERDCVTPFKLRGSSYVAGPSIRVPVLKGLT